MYWKNKYIKAIKENKQLIGDSVMRKAFFNQNKEAVTVEECRFPEFQADILEFRNFEGRCNLIGYEVKSDRDTLDRLEVQLKWYMKYCNYVFVLASLRHKKELLKILSNTGFEGVGVRFYYMSSEGSYFVNFRSAKFKENKGLNTDWITRKHKLYRWIYLLKDIWGEEW